MKRAIMIIAVVLLLAAVVVPVALAAVSSADADGTIARLNRPCPERRCADGFGSSCSCSGGGSLPKLPPRWPGA